MNDASDAIDTAAEWLERAPRVLVGAGAGLSVAAGIDYTDTVDFARHFPALVERGITARYQMIGRTHLHPLVFWGYWAAHVNDIRFSARRARVYTQLAELLASKNAFVLTSNVDAMFVRHGFDARRLCSIQGDYANMQCLKPCRRVVWDSKPSVEAILRTVDPATQAATDASIIPLCPHCGGAVFLNVRAGGWFVDEPYLPALERLQAWLLEESDTPLLVFDIGSGFNTPVVVRLPMEQVTARRASARLVRINPHHPEVPRSLGARALSLQMDALDAIAGIHERVLTTG